MELHAGRRQPSAVVLALLRGIAPDTGGNVMPAPVLRVAILSVAERAAWEPAGDRSSESETNGDEGVGEVPLRPRPRSRRRQLAVRPRGKNAAHVQQR